MGTVGSKLCARKMGAFTPIFLISQHSMIGVLDGSFMVFYYFLLHLKFVGL
jgi:hypothetical protein